MRFLGLLLVCSGFALAGPPGAWSPPEPLVRPAPSVLEKRVGSLERALAVQRARADALEAKLAAAPKPPGPATPRLDGLEGRLRAVERRAADTPLIRPADDTLAARVSALADRLAALERSAGWSRLAAGRLDTAEARLAALEVLTAARPAAAAPARYDPPEPPRVIAIVNGVPVLAPPGR